jgi:hypothetical protein
MGKIEFENRVRDRLQGKPYLEPIFSDCYDLTRLLREYDEQLFLVWDVRRQKYEIHSLGNQGLTYACDVPNNRLDSRVLTELRRGDLRLRGEKIFREIDEHNEYVRKSAENRRRDAIVDAAECMQSSFAKLAWEGV